MTFVSFSGPSHFYLSLSVASRNTVRTNTTRSSPLRLHVYPLALLFRICTYLSGFFFRLPSFVLIHNIHTLPTFQQFQTHSRKQSVAILVSNLMQGRHFACGISSPNLMLDKANHLFLGQSMNRGRLLGVLWSKPRAAYKDEITLPVTKGTLGDC